MEFKPDSLEAVIFFLAYVKAFNIMQITTFEDVLKKGILDEAEATLIESVIIGMQKTDTELESAIRETAQRTDKLDHILLALNRTLKAQNAICNIHEDKRPETVEGDQPTDTVRGLQEVCEGEAIHPLS